MNAVVEIKSSGALAAMTEQELVEILQSSLYPGAALPSIKMVLGYCKAAGLDPMQKPVHIVPMWDSKAKQMRDVIMPGVGLYRTQASRTERFAGQTEPEFGPMVTQKLGGVEITYPEWARVTVKKLMANGDIAEFTACEYWLENYAVKGGQEKSIAPNAMWSKRPRGQIAKCAAAQALRLAFPEMGAQPTAEEMEGKQLDDTAAPLPSTIKHMGNAEVVQAPSPTAAPADALPPFPQEDFDKNLPIWKKAAAKLSVNDVLARAEAANAAFAFTEQQKATILSIKAASMTFAQVAEKIAGAANADELAIAGDLIRQVADEAQRSELQGKYDAREQALTVEG